MEHRYSPLSTSQSFTQYAAFLGAKQGGVSVGKKPPWLAAVLLTAGTEKQEETGGALQHRCSSMPGKQQEGVQAMQP